MNRRSYCLAVGSASLAGLSGCLSSVGSYIGSGSDGYVRPDGEPDTVPATFACQRDGFERLYSHYDDEHLHWGDVGDYSLRVNALEFEYGETAKIELSADERGSNDDWNFEIYTANGWREVRGASDLENLGYTQELITSGAEWTIELTEAGITEGDPKEAMSNVDIDVCPDLVSGRYRFVYWGLTGEERDVDRGIAVAFDITV